MNDTEPRLYDAHAETCATRCSADVGANALNVSQFQGRLASFHTHDTYSRSSFEAF